MHLQKKPGRPTIPAMGDLGKFVRERRHELGLTLEEVAEQTGVSHQRISQIELGQVRGMKGLTAIRLARALDVSADELLDRLEAVVT
jgi:transcriptional regulator with XRE-family HTH domain